MELSTMMTSAAAERLRISAAKAIPSIDVGLARMKKPLPRQF